jgi:hypothetical protein
MPLSSEIRAWFIRTGTLSEFKLDRTGTIPSLKRRQRVTRDTKRVNLLADDPASPDDASSTDQKASTDETVVQLLDAYQTGSENEESPLSSPLSGDRSFAFSDGEDGNQSASGESAQSLLRSYRRQSGTMASMSSEGDTVGPDSAESEYKESQLDFPTPRQDLNSASAKDLASCWSGAKSALLSKMDALSFGDMSGKDLKKVRESLRKKTRLLYKSFNQDLSGALKHAMKRDQDVFYFEAFNISKEYLERLRSVNAWDYGGDVVWRDLGEVLTAIQQHCLSKVGAQPYRYSPAENGMG